jgi:DNA-nicking Smr family endonuclease
MKRSRPPVLDPPAPPRRRALSDDERALWDFVARQIKPLKKHRITKVLAVARPEPPPSLKHAPPARPVVAVPLPRPAKPAVPRLAPLGKRERAKLSRGRSEIDARIDLHGMTQARAHRALSGFLQQAHHDGLTFVLVITGKGRSGGESGVLRRQVPEWLSLPEFRSLIVGFEEAGIGHGGEGALYVRIRRARY